MELATGEGGGVRGGACYWLGWRYTDTDTEVRGVEHISGEAGGARSGVHLW